MVRAPSRSSTPGVNAPVATWIHYFTKRLKSAGISCANGLGEPAFEAEYLVCHALDLPFEQVERHLRRAVPENRRSELMRLLHLRAVERQPVAYITGEAFFAGRRYLVDPRVLIPRSRIENILDDDEGFPALMPEEGVGRILDLCTGSGCLAVALALVYPGARVDGADLSPEALAVAALNVARHDVADRVRLVASDLFAALAGERYDLIVTNPPYVPRRTHASLPPEYHQEPALALVAGEEGLDLVLPILLQAPDHLTPGGLLVCEVGDEVEETMGRKWPDLPVTWLMFHFGGSGVFVIHREELVEWVAHQGSGARERLFSEN